MALKIKADNDYTLLTQLLQVADLFIKIREREMVDQNLSTTAIDILFLVDAAGKDVTPAMITRRMLREPHSTSTILIRMANQGLLKRTKDMESKNHIRITLTAKGKKALKQAMAKEGTKNVLARLTTEQRNKLTKTLSILKEAGKKELRLNAKALQWP